MEWSILDSARLDFSASFSLLLEGAFARLRLNSNWEMAMAWKAMNCECVDGFQVNYVQSTHAEIECRHIENLDVSLEHLVRNTKDPESIRILCRELMLPRFIGNYLGICSIFFR